MNISEFKNFLGRIKGDFECKLRNRNSKNLTIEVCLFFYRAGSSTTFASPYERRTFRFKIIAPQKYWTSTSTSMGRFALIFGGGSFSTADS